MTIHKDILRFSEFGLPCKHTRIHTKTHSCTHTCTYTLISTHTHTRTHIHTCIHISMYINILHCWIYLYIHIYLIYASHICTSHMHLIYAPHICISHMHLTYMYDITANGAQWVCGHRRHGRRAITHNTRRGHDTRVFPDFAATVEREAAGSWRSCPSNPLRFVSVLYTYREREKEIHYAAEDVGGGLTFEHGTDTGWRRLIGCLKLQVIFRKRTTNYMALLQKMTHEDKASYDSTPPCTRVPCFGIRFRECPLRVLWHCCDMETHLLCFFSVCMGAYDSNIEWHGGCSVNLISLLTPRAPCVGF